MRFLGWNLAVATWLLISAFAFPHTPLSSAITWIAALLVASLAVLAAGRPAARFAITAVAFALAVLALLLPGMSTVAALNNAIVAAALFALSLVRPRHEHGALEHGTA